MEADYATANNECARTVNEASVRMDRDFDCNSFVQDNRTLFRAAVPFNFERVGNDVASFYRYFFHLQLLMLP
jgi:hypothetical protein